MADEQTNRLFMLLAIAVAVATIPVGLLLPDASGDRADASFVVTMVLVAASIGLAGFAITGRLVGVLIDERNKVSLSRLQILLWTVVVVSAIAAGAFANLSSGVGIDSLEFAIPQELWALLGISTATLVGAGIVKAEQASRPGSRLHTLAPDAAGAHRPQQARFKRASLIDLVRAEQEENWQTVDLAKVQALMFTLIIVFIYAATLFATFGEGPDQKTGLILASMPPLNNGLIALIGISHVGYVTVKAVSGAGPGAGPAAPAGAAPAGALDRPLPDDQRGED